MSARQEIIPEAIFGDTLFYPHDEPPARWWLELDGQPVKSRDEFEAVQWQVESARAVFPDHEGTAVWIRPPMAAAALAESMRYQHGIRTLSEVDDNYLAPRRQSLWMRGNAWSTGDRNEHLMALCSMNGVIFSTALLRDMYWKPIREKYKAAAKLLELHVCHNNVAETDWPEPIKSNGPVRVGWMGSPSHVWDLDLAWAAFMHARNLGAETWIIGYNPVEDVQANAVHKRARYKVDQWRKVGFKHVPWRQPDKYERLALPLDIGLCPLLTNQMTLGKSDVKVIEYGISGAACIAWNNPVYNRTIIHGETGLLVGSSQEMLEAVELLIKQPKLRETLVTNLQQYVREQRGEKQMKQEWTAAISG